MVAEIPLLYIYQEKHKEKPAAWLEGVQENKRLLNVRFAASVVYLKHNYPLCYRLGEQISPPNEEWVLDHSGSACKVLKKLVQSIAQTK